jgi:eukaryotic-like serine/threonine-protein kinase
VTHDDLPAGLLELAARIDEGEPIDWDAEERAASDADARAVIQGFRVLAGVAAIAQDAGSGLGAPPAWPCADVDLSGTAWGPLRLEEAVGRGAFSQVYRAIDPLGRHVAVKLLAPRLGGDDLSTRVLDEGRLLASVKHPNIVVVHGADEHDGRVGLWMEFVRGRTLAAEIDARGAHSPDEAIVVGRALCGALAAVHAKGLVHGDVKAHNVMREEGGRVVLMDFGAGQSMRPSPSGFDLLAGTPLYLCPERLSGG